jgi:uncharacterized iron-regulated membrane protein
MGIRVVQRHGLHTRLETVDAAWARLVDRHRDAEVIIVNFPPSPSDSVRFVVNPDRRTYYKTDHYYIDQNSGAELPVDHSWGLYCNATPAAVVRRANYDVHVGAIAGLPGKLLAFAAGLIGVGLPVTGLRLWLAKRRNQCPLPQSTQATSSRNPP